MLARLLTLALLVLPLLAQQPLVANAAGAPSLTDPRYFAGVNLPWFNWGCDFGCGSKSGVSAPAVRSSLADGFGRLKDSGVHTVRWWTFEGDQPWQINHDESGRPAGLNPAVYADFDTALALADQYDLVYEFVLFSSPTNLPKAWVMDPAQRQRLADSLAPLFERYKGNPHILAWEIFNEPEWDIWNNKIPQGPVQELVKVIASTVHAHGSASVTVGSATLEGLPLWLGQGLDFYSPHWYDTMSSGGACARCTDVATIRARYHLDGLPIVIGEFYSGPDTDALQRFKDFRAKGYGGAWAWSLFYDHTGDKLRIDLGAVAAFTSDKGSPPEGTPPPSTPVPATPPQTTPSSTGSTLSVDLLANWVSPVYAAPGQTITFSQDLRSSTDTSVLVAFEVDDQGGRSTAAATIDNQPLAAGQVASTSTTVALPATLLPGQYIVKVSVFSPDRGTLYASSDTVGSFVVETPSVTPPQPVAGPAQSDPAPPDASSSDNDLPAPASGE